MNLHRKRSSPKKGSLAAANEHIRKQCTLPANLFMRAPNCFGARFNCRQFNRMGADKVQLYPRASVGVYFTFIICRVRSAFHSLRARGASPFESARKFDAMCSYRRYGLLIIAHMCRQVHLHYTRPLPLCVHWPVNWVWKWTPYSKIGSLMQIPAIFSTLNA